MIDHWHKRILQVSFAFLIIRLLTAAVLPLSADESYYWLWAKNLSLSYFDHPPMVAWWIAFSTSILGDSQLAIRFFAPLTVFIISLMAAYYARLKVDGKSALSLVVAIQIIPLFNLGGIIITPDTPLFFFWVMALIFLLSTSGRLNFKKGLMLGVIVGLGLLSKYSMILFPLITLIYLAGVKHCRSWFKGFAASILTASLIFLPVIIWNMQNDWASFAFQLNHGTSQTGNILENTTSFIAAQLGLFSLGFFYLLILWSLDKRRRLSKFDSVKIFALLPILFFLPFAIFSHSEAGWTAVAYPAALWGTWLAVFKTHDIYKKFWNVSLAIALLFSTLMYLWAFGVFKSNDVLGQFDHLKLETNTMLENLPEKFTALPVVAQSYQIASMYTYYMQFDDYRMPVLASENARKSQFDYWKNDIRLNGGFIWIVEHQKNILPDSNLFVQMDCAYANELWPKKQTRNPRYKFLICTPK